MISNGYKIELIKEARRLDTFLGEASDFGKLVLEITEEQNNRAILELIKKYSLIKVDQKQERITELLCKYLGAIKVEGISEELEESSNTSYDELISQLNELVGLENVKQQVADLIDYNQTQNTIQSGKVLQRLRQQAVSTHLSLILQRIPLQLNILHLQRLQ